MRVARDSPRACWTYDKNRGWRKIHGKYRKPPINGDYSWENQRTKWLNENVCWNRETCGLLVADDDACTLLQACVGHRLLSQKKRCGLVFLSHTITMSPLDEIQKEMKKSNPKSWFLGRATCQREGIYYIYPSYVKCMVYSTKFRQVLSCYTHFASLNLASMGLSARVVRSPQTWLCS